MYKNYILVYYLYLIIYIYICISKFNRKKSYSYRKLDITARSIQYYFPWFILIFSSLFILLNLSDNLHFNYYYLYKNRQISKIIISIVPFLFYLKLLSIHLQSWHLTRWNWLSKQWIKTLTSTDLCFPQLLSNPSSSYVVDKSMRASIEQDRYFYQFFDASYGHRIYYCYRVQNVEALNASLNFAIGVKLLRKVDTTPVDRTYFVIWIIHLLKLIPSDLNTFKHTLKRSHRKNRQYT